MMATCDDTRERLLDLLYGLLEPSEEGALRDHLTTCPACTQAYADALRTRQMIAAAAVASFPEVRFCRPTDATAESSLDSSVRAEPRLATRGPLHSIFQSLMRGPTRFVLAASLLLAVAAFGFNLMQWDKPSGSVSPIIAQAPAPTPQSELPVLAPEFQQIRFSTRVREQASMLEAERSSYDWRTVIVVEKKQVQPGEAIFFRSLTLDRRTKKPPVGVQPPPALRFELRDAQGKPIVEHTAIVGVTNPMLDADEVEYGSGLAYGGLAVPTTLAEGVYTLAAVEARPLAIPVVHEIASEKIIVSRMQPEQLTKLIEWDAPAYQPGQAVTATLKVTRAGKAYARRSFRVELVEDANNPLPIESPASGISELDPSGQATIRFTLPNRKLGTIKLSVEMQDQTMESVTVPVPIRQN